MDIVLVKVKESDFPAIKAIFLRVIAGGDSYIYTSDITDEKMWSIWMENLTYVAKIDQQIVGVYSVRPNKDGRGSHVANASFMVDPDFRGKRIGYRLAVHALQEAKTSGYAAMQFNVVVSTNHRAVSLWKSLGFSVIGTVPKAFDHAVLGLVDVFIMHRFL